MTPQEITACARTYVGSPWRHQGRLKGKAVDCIGLIVGVAKELGFTEALFNEPYGPTPDGHRLAREFEARCDIMWKPDPLEPMIVNPNDFQEGDIALMAWKTYPMHCAFLARGNETWNIIHSFAQIGRVCEHGYDDVWLARTKAVYRFKGM